MKFININQNTLMIRDVLMGEGVTYYSFVNLYQCTIHDNTKIGTFVEIQKNVVIGKRCKISSHTFICEGVHIGDDVFVGHGVMFTNDKFPRASLDGHLVTNQWVMQETRVEDQVAIGSNATILGGIRIGRGAMIGAGAVVTKDVAPGTTVVGNPAREIGSGSSERVTYPLPEHNKR